jgi:hypothetical protein
VSANTRVLVGTLPVATVADQALVAGCPFSPGSPRPCVRVQWLTPAVRVLVNGQPPLLQTSAGLGLAADQAPQGPPLPVSVQPRVIAT